MAILMNVPDLTFMILLFPPFGLGITLAPVLKILYLFIFLGDWRFSLKIVLEFRHFFSNEKKSLNSSIKELNKLYIS